ncbi:MAG TPA: histidine phosphatase family protein [Caldilineaceae bacterium]|nr:histidine phosphatase family protein [Caldilineaceae bacterium]
MSDHCPPRTPSVARARLILVRHGETEANVSQVWHGALDAPLTERGRAQVAATAAWLSDLHRRQPLDGFYVSPLPRAQSTAAAIAAAIGRQPVVVEGLREFSIGDWEGRSFRELREVEDLWGRWEADPCFAPPNGESPRSFNRRVVETVIKLVDRHPDGTALAVSHGGVIGSVLATLVGDGPDDWRRFDPHNCAVSVLQWQEGRWSGELINATDHLPLVARADYEPDY